MATHGESGSRQWGLSEAAYGESPMAAVSTRRPGARACAAHPRALLRSDRTRRVPNRVPESANIPHNQTGTP
jgi:hypothetical protein